jgi:hypothetical protein
MLSVVGKGIAMWGINIAIFSTYAAYAVWREKINLKAMAKSVLKRK